MQTQLTFSTLHISGEDASTFLQGQFTCDITLASDQNSYGAYCDHRGRMISNFMIKKENNDFIMTLPESISAATLTQLKKFGAFSKVAITATGSPFTEDKLSYLQQGIAFIYPETSLLFTPQMINWEKHGGVSFEKGCYVGQEIVARTQHLGKLKRHLHELTIEQTDSITPGDKLVNPQGDTIGIVCDAASSDKGALCLAVIQDRALDDAILLNDTLCLVAQ